MTTRCAFVSPQSLALHALWAYLVHLTGRMVSMGKSLFSKKDESHYRPSDNSERSNQSWAGREYSTISDYDTERQLEADIFRTAYSTTFDTALSPSPPLAW
ncbi:hypothetical protein C8Q70DRAFT_541597 [Cubamyces menziesii]|nr:hypothetical protein C8Q70DRAFT_541597 [Cubamyces menziesii]